MPLINKRTKQRGKGRFEIEEDIIILDCVANDKSLNEMITALKEQGYNRTRQVIRTRIDTLNSQPAGTTILQVHGISKEDLFKRWNESKQQ